MYSPLKKFHNQTDATVYSNSEFCLLGVDGGSLGFVPCGQSYSSRNLSLFRSLKAVYYTVVVHNSNLQEKSTSTVDKDNKSV